VAQEQVVISVADDQVADLDSVVEALRQAGLRVSEVLDSVGVVTGTVDGDALGTLSTVPGVAEVERSREFQLPAD
jgi:prophage DNA circulation protein